MDHDFWKPYKGAMRTFKSSVSASPYCPSFVACLGYQQSNWLCNQLVLQHERVGADLGQSRLSCLQLFTEVSRYVVYQHCEELIIVSGRFDVTSQRSLVVKAVLICLCSVVFV